MRFKSKDFRIYFDLQFWQYWHNVRATRSMILAKVTWTQMWFICTTKRFTFQCPFEAKVPWLRWVFSTLMTQKHITDYLAPMNTLWMGWDWFVFTKWIYAFHISYNNNSRKKKLFTACSISCVILHLQWQENRETVISSTNHAFRKILPIFQGR